MYRNRERNQGKIHFQYKDETRKKETVIAIIECYTSEKNWVYVGTCILAVRRWDEKLGSKNASFYASLQRTTKTMRPMVKKCY